ncbi:MAG: hypothetical protein ABW321_07210 [Polyangiales bacterium]
MSHDDCPDNMLCVSRRCQARGAAPSGARTREDPSLGERARASTQPRVTAACSGKQPAEATCVSDDRIGTCGPDLVDIVPGERCDAPQVCRDGACSCACDGMCYDLKTDADHCGRCDRSCGGRACVDGQCEPEVVLTGGSYSDIASDATHVYWVNPAARTLSMRSADGTQEIQLGDHVASNALLVDDTHVYFGSDVGIAKVGKRGGDVSILVEGGQFWWVAQNAAHLFSWYDGSIHMIPKAGGAVTTLSSNDGIHPYRLVANERDVYWTDEEDGLVMKTSIDTARKTTIATGEDAPTAITLAGGYVYWTARSGLSRVLMAGGPIETLGESTQLLAATDQHVYTTTWTSGGILSTPLDEATPLARFVQRATPIYNLTAQADYVYWVATRQGDQCPCALMRTPR